MKEAKSLVERLAEIDDPRIQGLVTYPLVEILFAVLTGVLCRMEEWDDIVDFAEANLDWLRQFLPYASGIASDKTFRLVFSRIDHKAFAAMFAAWAAQWSRGGVIAIDAKTLRGTGESGKARSALHVLNAVAHDSGMILGHRPVDGKSNEITAIPEFLESLAVDGAIVTIDAMGTQKHIAATIIKPKADYVLALKGNQNSLHDDVRRFFDEPILAAGCAAFPTTDAGHGRIEERVCRVTDNIGWLQELHPHWNGLRAILAITATRATKKTGETSTETRYYITSLPANPEVLLQATRSHWSIENRVHWVLDVIFREDQSRTRKDYAAINLSLVRKIALNLLRQDTSCALSLKRKRLKASLNPSYRSAVINHS
ncbi:MAG: ISAs1 family transposase [Acidobacteria bacterium]|nr:ISAs1 family transposase [Acidobacteriota bacterium]